MDGAKPRRVGVLAVLACASALLVIAIVWTMAAPPASRAAYLPGCDECTLKPVRGTFGARPFSSEETKVAVAHGARVVSEQLRRLLAAA